MAVSTSDEVAQRALRLVVAAQAVYDDAQRTKPQLAQLPGRCVIMNFADRLLQSFAVGAASCRRLTAVCQVGKERDDVIDGWVF